MGQVLPIFSFTFDDGNSSQIRELYPILEKHGFPATFYVLPTQIGKPGKLSMDDLRHLANEKNEIGSHGLTHKSLPRLSLRQIKDELETSKDLLNAFGARSFAYPYGHYDQRVVLEASRVYDSARAMRADIIMNRVGSLQPHALQSFQVEGRFAARIDQSEDKYLLHEPIKSNEWAIITMHGTASISRWKIPNILKLEKLTREQCRSYANYLRSRLTSNHTVIAKALEAFCSDLAFKKINVLTVSDALDQLR
jgi:peptidoglycan/xylan/chitin deacetylase (PgdA/CDA1 family)